MGWNQLLKFGLNQFQSCRKIFTTFLFATSITPWQMHPTCTNGAKQHHVYLHCNKNQTLGHMVAWCQTSLREKRYNYRHDSILLNIGRILESVKSIDIYIDIPGYKCPTMITCPTMIQRSDLIVISNNKLHLLELTAGYETNIDLNCKRKEKTIEHSWTD